jgi:RNA polymerase sigma-70 factor (ECF subfamily)
MTSKRVLLPISEDACDPRRLLELVRSGDAGSLDQITRCYGARLMAAGRRHCRTFSEAEDAVQDTLLIASSELASFRGEGSLEGFLVRIVARACRRISRGKKNDPALHDVEHSPIDTASSPEADAQRRELGAALDQLLLALEPSDRAILLLAELEDYTGPQIASELGLSAGAVRTRLTRLRKRLREGLEPFVPLAASSQ